LEECTVSDVLGSILPLAIAVAISPVPIIAEILLLFTDRRVANAGAFVVGFTVGVAGVLGMLVVLAGTQDLSSGTDASTASAIIGMVLGALLIVGAVRQFRGRPGPGKTAPTPKWMDGISAFQPGRSLAAGLVVGAVNPKNIAMAIGTSRVIAGAGLSAGEDVVVVVVYTLVAILGVAAPLVVMLVMGDRAQGILDGWKSWLGQNNAAVMSVLFLVFGIVLIGQGLQDI
jgi:threonine/homoserine/homoserine lactone efflux protein